MTWVHWVLYDLPPSASKLPEAAGGLRPAPKSNSMTRKRLGMAAPARLLGGTDTSANFTLSTSNSQNCDAPQKRKSKAR